MGVNGSSVVVAAAGECSFPWPLGVCGGGAGLVASGRRGGSPSSSDQSKRSIDADVGGSGWAETGMRVVCGRQSLPALPGLFFVFPLANIVFDSSAGSSYLLRPLARPTRSIENQNRHSARIFTVCDHSRVVIKCLE